MTETIAVHSFGAAADVLYATPIVRYIRKLHPDSHITWFVRDKFQNVVETNTDIDAIKPYELPIVEESRQENEKIMDQQILQDIKEGPYDFVYDLQYWPRYHNFYENPNEDFVSLRARNAGLDSSEIKDRRVVLELTKGDFDKADDLGVDWNKTITINHISYAAQPVLSFQQYCQLARALRHGKNLIPLFTGALDEQIPFWGEDARGITYRQWAACIKRSALWLGLDSGAVALAASTDTPIIKLHSPGFPLAKTGIKAMGLRTDDRVLELTTPPTVDTLVDLIMEYKR